MGSVRFVKELLVAVFQWNVLVKSFIVGVLSGAALTLANYGRVWTNGSCPVWWKLLLNFAIPFIAEAIVCVFSNFFQKSPTVAEVALHEIKQDQHSPLPKISIQTAMSPFGKKVESTGMDMHHYRHTKFYEDPTLQSQPSWTLPTSPETSPTSRPCYVRMHTNSMAMFPVDEELVSMHEKSDDTTTVPIRPLPKETLRKPFRAKSLGCISDLHGKQRIRISNAERLHVYNNGLYGGDSPHAFRPLD